MSEQKNPAAGGRYVVEKPGEAPKRVEAPKQHEDGARARAADGTRLNRPAVPAAPTAPAAPPAPAPPAPARPAKS